MHCEEVFPETLAENDLRCDPFKYEVTVLKRLGTVQEIFRRKSSFHIEGIFCGFVHLLFVGILIVFQPCDVLAAQMCFYNQISQTVKFYVSLRAFKIRTGVIASFNPRRQSEYGDKVISTICVFQNIHRECFLTSFVLCGLLRSSFFPP